MNIMPIRALKDNYIWAIVKEKAVVIVDPGEAAPVLAFLNENGFTLVGIFITHHHGDHTHGMAELLKQCGNVPVYGSHQSTIREINHHVKEGDLITCHHFTCRAIEIPGHTLDHTAYYSESDALVFTGDTLFSAGCGRIFEGDPAMMLASLTKLAALPDNTLVYCGHEYTKANLQFAKVVEPFNQAIDTKLSTLGDCTLPSQIGAEKTFNPFLRCQESDVIAAVGGGTEVEVFAKVREWKNKF